MSFLLSFANSGRWYLLHLYMSLKELAELVISFLCSISSLQYCGYFKSLSYLIDLYTSFPLEQILELRNSGCPILILEKHHKLYLLLSTCSHFPERIVFFLRNNHQANHSQGLLRCNSSVYLQESFNPRYRIEFSNLRNCTSTTHSKVLLPTNWREIEKIFVTNNSTAKLFSQIWELLKKTN